ncbi:MAG: hypothetical protein Q4A43_05795 [Coriobacteriia bacterium]|nr:hypothetical protein [Coriobacteriia bacterium]
MEGKAIGLRAKNLIGLSLVAVLAVGSIPSISKIEVAYADGAGEKVGSLSSESNLSKASQLKSELLEGCSENDSNQISSDVQMLDQLGLETSNIVDVEKSENQFSYRFKNECLSDSSVKVEKTSQGVISLDVTEGDLHNDVVFTPSGKIYLDGEEVVVTEESEATVTVADNVEPAQFVASKSTKDPLHGKATYYYYGADKVKSLKLAKSIKDLALEAFISIVTAIMTKNGGLAVTVTSYGYKALTSLSPYSKVMSISQKKYKPNKKDYAGKFTGVAKAVTTYYTKANYKGSKKSYTSYYFTNAY